MYKQSSVLGTPVRAQEITKLIDHIIASNQIAEQQAKRKTPLCIWGNHGIGKTALVKSYAQKNGFHFAYIAPAQFEEMGDLLGMPKIRNEQTSFAPPDWVPQIDGPGILLIDDVNRADDRILRGIMQLLQFYELASWKLPAQWHILLTANPDDGHYSVTPMDDALLTRMMHVQMIFDAKDWAEWAKQAQVSPIAIQFVLAHPDLVGQRTTPRTLVQFFDAIAGLPDLKANVAMIQILGDACLDEQTVADFIDFIEKDLGLFANPKTIFEAVDFSTEVAIPLRDALGKQGERSNILNAINTNLIGHLQTHKLDQAAIENLKKYILLDFVPADIRLLFAQHLVELGRNDLKALLTTPEISILLMG